MVIRKNDLTLRARVLSLGRDRQRAKVLNFWPGYPVESAREVLPMSSRDDRQRKAGGHCCLRPSRHPPAQPGGLSPHRQRETLDGKPRTPPRLPYSPRGANAPEHSYRWPTGRDGQASCLDCASLRVGHCATGSDSCRAETRPGIPSIGYGYAPTPYTRRRPGKGITPYRATRLTAP